MKGNAVRRTAATLDPPLAPALAMAGEHPARFLSLDGGLGRIAPGHRASLVAIGDGDRVEVSRIDGVRQPV